MKTWITVINGCINNVRESSSDTSPGEEWIEVPNNFSGAYGDKWPEWFDVNKQRLHNDKLVEQGKRIDKRGRWYSKEKIGETTIIHNLDEDIDENEWTRDAPLENESYQIFDRQQNKWVVDTEKKESAEKENTIMQVQLRIDDAERRIQRSTRAKLAGTATEEDDRYFTEINTEINRLREEKRHLLLSA